MCSVALIPLTFPIPSLNTVLYFRRIDWTFIYPSVFTVETCIMFLMFCQSILISFSHDLPNKFVVPFSTTYSWPSALCPLCSTVTSITPRDFNFSPKSVRSFILHGFMGWFPKIGIFSEISRTQLIRYPIPSLSLYHLPLLVKGLAHPHFSLRYISLIVQFLL